MDWNPEQMKRSYVQIAGVLYERGHEPVAAGPMVIDDIQPYRSMADGSIITSRSKHREHLKTHGCVEIGDQVHHLQVQRPTFESPARKELIRAQIDAMSHAEFKGAIRRFVERVKWNSR